MRTREETHKRQIELEETLWLLQREREDELAKPINKRSQARLLFLYKETAVHEAALSELEWMLNEEKKINTNSNLGWIGRRRAHNAIFASAKAQTT